MNSYPADSTEFTATVSESPQFFQYIPDEIAVDPQLPGNPVRPLLSQNHPNPFKGTTAIRFRFPSSGEPVGIPYRLDVFDVGGRLVRSLAGGRGGSDWSSVTWDGLDASGGQVPAGTYWYRLTTPDGATARRMILTK
jgi:hypothetical protein